MKRPIRRVLVIAAHPDDEVLGCGGTLALHTRVGDEVHAAIACEGESLRYGPEGVGQAQHMEQAARALGLQDVRLLGFPDQRLDTVTLTDIIAPLEQRVREVRPEDDRWTSGAAHHYADLSAWYRENLKETE